MDALTPVLDYIKTQEDTAISRLLDYLRHPSISAENTGIREVAEMLLAQLSGMGFEAELVESTGHPFVLGQYRVDPALPTVLFYGHYDVQPADPAEEWITPAFEPTIRDGRIFARGAGDNKGQHFAQLLAIEAHLKVHGTLPCNVIVCLEGEEEIGSPHIAEFVETHKDRLQADLVITADGPLHPSGDPIIVCGVRGVVSFDLVAEGAARDAHSGNFGGVLQQPAWDLVQLLATMKNTRGEITIEGINETVTPPTEAELTAMDRLPLDMVALQEEMQFETMEAPADRPYWQRLMFHPTLTINGIHAGYGGPGTKTVLPCVASAKCDMRLVEPLTPDFVMERIRAHVAKHAPHIKVIEQDGMYPSKTPIDSAWTGVIETALTRARGVKPHIYPSLGGSLPEYVWTKILKKPAFVVPYANADEANHAPNENIEVQRYLDGIRCGAALLHEIAKSG